MKVLLAALLFACAYALASAFTLEQQLNYCQDKLAGAETAKVAAQNQLNTVLAAVSTLSNELKAAHKAGRIIQQQLDRCLRKFLSTCQELSAPPGRSVRDHPDLAPFPSAPSGVDPGDYPAAIAQCWEEVHLTNNETAQLVQLYNEAYENSGQLPGKPSAPQLQQDLDVQNDYNDFLTAALEHCEARLDQLNDTRKRANPALLNCPGAGLSPDPGFTP